MARQTVHPPLHPQRGAGRQGGHAARDGLESVEEIYAEIPDRLRFKGTLDIPEAILSERDLRRHVKGLLDRNTVVRRLPQLLRRRLLAALRAGRRRRGRQPGRVRERLLRRQLLRPRQVHGPLRVQQHARRAARPRRRRQPHLRLGRRGGALVPHGEPHHRPQAGAGLRQREPHATGGDPHAVPARGHAHARQARLRRVGPRHRPHGPRRPAVRSSATTSPPCTGRTPATWASSRRRAPRSCALAHEAGALAIAGVDPITLGVLTPPGTLGADIAVGDIQPLGMHMHAGGGCSGFIAFRDDDPVFAQECPLELYTLSRPRCPASAIVAEAMAERTSYGSRDQGKDWVGTASGLWTIARRRLHGAHGTAGLQGDRRDLHRAARTTRPSCSARFPA